MTSNRNWLPAYCDPNSFLPMVQRAHLVFSRPPLLFQDFVGKAIAFLQTDTVRDLGFELDLASTLPCKWKCSDECVFGVDLSLFAYTGQYPFDKGRIGGYFNHTSVGAAVHHAPINLDFGGAHVGYSPGENGGTFGYIKRPLHAGKSSTDCGYLSAMLAPFVETYNDACANITLSKPSSDIILSIPNEFLQPSWSSHNIKLLVDMDRLLKRPVEYEPVRTHTYNLPGRSRFLASQKFLEQLDLSFLHSLTDAAVPIGGHLTADFFHIFDDEAKLNPDGSPEERLLPYMKHILADQLVPAPLKAAVINTCIEHNRLTDCVRAPVYRGYAFASFTGIFIDMFDQHNNAYINLFQPIALSIKPAGRQPEYDFHLSQLHDHLEKLAPVKPVLPLAGVLGYNHPVHLLEQFTFRVD